MKKTLFILLASTFLFGCNKEVDANDPEQEVINTPQPKPCEVNNTGDLKLISTQLDDYYVYLNDKYIGIARSTKINTFNDVPAGNKSIDLININDWNDAYEGTISIKKCKTTSADF